MDQGWGGWERAGWGLKALTKKGTLFLCVWQWKLSCTMCVSGNQALSSSLNMCMEKAGKTTTFIPLTNCCQRALTVQGQLAWTGWPALRIWFTFFRSSRSNFSIPSSWSTLEARVGEEFLLLGTRNKRPCWPEPPWLALFGIFFFLRRRLSLPNGFQCQMTQYGDTTVHFHFKKENGSPNRR